MFSPCPAPVCRETPVVFAVCLSPDWGLAFWPDGRVSFLSEMEDSTRLRLLEQVGSPVLCVKERVKKETRAARVLQALMCYQD